MSIYRINSELAYKDLETLGRQMCKYPALFISLFNDASFRIWLRSIDEQRAKEALAVFNATPDKTVGLFKASYIFNPAHKLVFAGQSYPDLDSLGRAILKRAPQVEPTAVALLNTQSLAWYLNYKNIAKSQPDLANKITELSIASRGLPALSVFRLGFLLSPVKAFWFEGHEYASSQEFLAQKANDTRIMTTYDFLSMPYMQAYYEAVGRAKVYEFAQRIAATNLRADENFIKAFNEANGDKDA